MNNKPSFLKTAFLTAILLISQILSYSPIPKAFSKYYTSESSEDTEIYYTEGQDYATIKVNYGVKMNSEDFYYDPGNETITLYNISESTPENNKFILDSLKITHGSTEIQNYTAEETDSAIVLTIYRNQQIRRFRPYRITIEYKTKDYIKQIGNLDMIFVLGFQEGVELEDYNNESGTSWKSNYSATIHYTGEKSPSTYYPDSVNITETDNGYTIKYDEDDLLKGGGSVTFGENQYYYFKINQKAPKTDTITPSGLGKISDKVSTNFYTINLPREFSETSQRIYYKQIYPSPTKITRDPDGNLNALFEMPATKDSEIIIEGYILIDHRDKNITDISLEKYFEEIAASGNFDKYLESSLYWEVEHPTIRQIAQELKSGKTTLLELVRADYDYLVDKYDYSILKAASYNERQGALASLQGSEAVCMEYADSMIAILRAQGVPARAAVGYSNDPNELDFSIDSITENEDIDPNLLEEIIEINNGNKTSDDNNTYIEPTSHQWLQVWLPEYGWLSIDPTWGESNIEYIGPDMEHVLWFTYDDFFNIPNSISTFSSDFLINPDLVGDGYTIEIKPISQSEFESAESSLRDEQGYFRDLQSFVGSPIQDVDSQGKSIDPATGKSTQWKENLDIALRGTCIGRALILFSPVCLVLVLVLFLLVLLARGMRRRRNKSKFVANREA
ncbi:hypothetical protein GF357_04510 [Candidatus Dojkabacteria bacterium]|nr:hypothetical protein [Candidatus Dojkabacteria bacterium]